MALPVRSFFYYRDSGFVEKYQIMELAVRNYFSHLFSPKYWQKGNKKTDY